MNNTLMGRVAWVTGGGSGIGLAGALELVKAGVHVVISGRNATTNASALEQLQAFGSAEAILLDVADKNAVQAASKHILTSHGRIDILINSAGMNATKRNLDCQHQPQWLVLLRAFGTSDHASTRGWAHHQCIVLGWALCFKVNRPSL